MIVLNYLEKAQSHWAMDTKHMQKGHSGRAKFWGWFHPLSSTLEMDRNGENLQKQRGKEWTWVVCSGDVKWICMGSMADGSG